MMKNLCVVCSLVMLFGCSSGGGGGGGNNPPPTGDPITPIDPINPIDGPIVTKEKVSAHGATDSHTDERRGDNCARCHYNGNNDYVFYVSGSVYNLLDIENVYPNATIKLYSAENGGGNLIATLEVDANGNFYSTEPLDLSFGLYPRIEGTAGEPPIDMGNFITHGNCNGCHGVTTLPIYIGEEFKDNEQRVSTHGTTLSHTDKRRGENCMLCHDGYFMAGTVYDLGLEDFYADATIYLYPTADTNGDAAETLEVDANGNFYTTKPINFGDGLYPVVEDATGNSRVNMSSSITNGACSSCHGVSTLPLFVGEKVNKKISQHGTTNSHTDERRGQNCMDCHIEGSNEYVYSAAGTVYQENDPTLYFPNATIELYTRQGGKGNLVARIEVDNNANFYTTDAIDFGEGLYPTVIGNGREADPLHMPNSVTDGECNACHNGVETNRILAPGNATEIASAHGTTYSHDDGRRGQNCLACHAIGGDNDHQYSVAGSVYNLDLINYYPDATIYLYTEPSGQGDLVAEIQVDAYGNFYTTSEIDLGKGKGKGLYPAVKGSAEDSPYIYMETPTNDGACSSSGCHGVNRPPIYAK